MPEGQRVPQLKVGPREEDTLQVGVSASLHAPAAALGERFGTFAARAWRHWRSTSNTVLVNLENAYPRPRHAAVRKLAPGCMEVRTKRGLQELTTPWTCILSRKFYLVLMVISPSSEVPARHTFWGQDAHMQPEQKSMQNLMLL